MLITDSKEEQERCQDLFSMLTPIVKDYMAVKGHEVCCQVSGRPLAAGATSLIEEETEVSY